MECVPENIARHPCTILINKLDLYNPLFFQRAQEIQTNEELHEKHDIRAHRQSDILSLG